MGLAGCGSIEELRTKAQFVRISPRLSRLVQLEH
jgi:hypothetical protein